MLAKKYREARLGLLLCPTNSFASLLYELGRQRAQENVVRERPAIYSGMMSYKKAVRELPYLGDIFEMPILVAGVGVRGSRTQINCPCPDPRPFIDGRNDLASIAN
jgi:hypothetical protein